MNEWVNRKLALAEQLAAGNCGGGEDDAILVLSAVMSAIAAFLWPSKSRTDRKRFVELWARYAGKSLMPNQVSVPLLIESLRGKGKHDVAEVLRLLKRDHLGSIPEFDDSVVSGLQVDLAEDIVTAATSLSLSDVRAISAIQSIRKWIRRNGGSSHPPSYNTALRSSVMRAAPPRVPT